MPLAVFAILFGLDASSDVIRERTKCSRCGQVGARTILPSRNGLGVPSVMKVTP